MYVGAATQTSKAHQNLFFACCRMRGVAIKEFEEAAVRLSPAGASIASYLLLVVYIK